MSWKLVYVYKYTPCAVPPAISTFLVGTLLVELSTVDYILSLYIYIYIYVYGVTIHKYLKKN